MSTWTTPTDSLTEDSLTENSLTENNADVTVRIMMVDDDPFEHVLMEDAAKEAGLGLDLTFFQDGAAALLELIGTPREELPDLIVLDLRMPGVDGHTTLDELQADPVLWQIPVVVFTSSPLKDDINASASGGAVSYVVKPSDFSAMIDFIGRIRDIAQSGVTPRRVEPSAVGRGELREAAEQGEAKARDYLFQLQVSASARRHEAGS